MTARPLVYLDDPEAAEALAYGFELPPAHIRAELRWRWWFWRRHGWRLPAERRVIVFQEGST